MLILVLCRTADGVEEAGFRRHLPAETAALRELKAGGVLADAWSPADPVQCSCSTCPARQKRPLSPLPSR